MKAAPGKIGFNKAWVKKVGKEKFLKHFKDVYPDHDLSAEYDKIVPPKEEKKEPKPGK